jgi:hypothetical protein
VIQRLDHPTLGPVALIRPAHGLKAQEGHIPKAPPLLGEDTRAVLSGVLGYDSPRIEALIKAGVVSCAFDAPADLAQAGAPREASPQPTSRASA